jgi:hypothetical protein
VAADGDDQTLLSARFSVARVIAQADVVAQRAAEKDVVPCGDGQRGNLNVLVVLFDGPLLPVVVVGGMCEPVLVVGSELLCELRRFRWAGPVEDREPVRSARPEAGFL